MLRRCVRNNYKILVRFEDIASKGITDVKLLVRYTEIKGDDEKLRDTILIELGRLKERNVTDMLGLIETLG